jgi:formylglycine-generating enzyme required for sulfatase activity
LEKAQESTDAEVRHRAGVILWEIYWPFDAAEARRRQQETARRLGISVEQEADLGGGVKMKLVLIPAGAFLMGSADTKKDHPDDEIPHKVRLTKAFFMGATTVTNEQYRRFKADYDSGSYEGNSFNDDKQPVVMVSWDEATEFCTWMSKQTGMTVRLPTEAEWEYAARAGTTTRFCGGDDDGALDAYGWYDGNSGHKTHPVGQKKANAFGLYDMHGNVWQWCSDWYGAYPNGDQVDPTGAAQSALRVMRGGGWYYAPGVCRSAYRRDESPGLRLNDFGFRVVVVALSRTP